jgi:hypothetical protein
MGTRQALSVDVCSCSLTISMLPIVFLTTYATPSLTIFSVDRTRTDNRSPHYEQVGQTPSRGTVMVNDGA